MLESKHNKQTRPGSNKRHNHGQEHHLIQLGPNSNIYEYHTTQRAHVITLLYTHLYVIIYCREVAVAVAQLETIDKVTDFSS